MKAIMQDRYGTVDVLQLRDIDKPVPGDDEVLIRVRAAGVDPGVWHFMTGLPLFARLFLGLRKPRAAVRGRDVAGEVVSVGGNVSEFTTGDKVFGTCGGSFAEFVAVKPNRLAPIPSGVSFVQAAAVPVSGCTALLALRDAAKIAEGERCLIIGAAGGVGTYAVQLAKAFGATVTGVCSTSKVGLVTSIGADAVIDYVKEDFADRPERYDVIIDLAGNRPLPRLRQVLTERGRLVLAGGEDGGRVLGGMERNLGAALLSPWVKQRLNWFISKEDPKDLRRLAELIEAKDIMPVIDRTYPLSEAAEAIRHLKAGNARGKLVIDMDA
ncbi:NAD(P)-dependent alcohol dehydrogenase [Stackebrandtia nassauensis]|uniref:Alcohol dehydrogenase zinc-binding domain protein n=1 Tax=Stackebrandtia nassauensis (strain DSM 44728 / CIP 108903 / NRRL B-16338 / NBRC 102104 / LLR-40K-21) TaxID=446470 RepID=D3Q7R4_STANL|nr:NAD(P)-dependent alcohol dehydrogenase [Stackebrandtia nassauensis]ADD44406.1 Alcohol dehydrogenase zinc-binding domain protein [Stackebrandtia nassauensis DSM 44728]